VMPPPVLSRGLPLSGRPSQLAVLVLALLAPVPAVALALRRRTPKLRAFVARPGAVPALDTLRTLPLDPANPSEHARSARRALHVALAERLGVPPQVLVSRRQVRRVLRRRGVTRAGTACVIELLEDLDAHGFADAASGNGSGSFVERATQCFAIVDGEAVQRGAGGSLDARDGGVRGSPGTLLLLLALASPAATIQALQAQGTPAAANVEVGVLANSGTRQSAVPSPVLVRAAADAYQRRLFTDAEQRFGDLVRAHPADAGLLVNWGTAAWAAGDTVNAVIAWHRAARVDPLAVDVQERLMMLPSGARGGVAEVPMVPVQFLQLLAITLWLVGWAAAAWLELRRRRMAEYHLTSHHPTRWSGLLGGVIWLCLFGAVTATGSALWGRGALSPARLAVVVRPETMHIAPGSDSDAMGGVATGDIVRRLEEQGGWERVVHSDGRAGWLPAVRLIALVPAADPVDVSAPDALMELDSTRLELVVPR